MDTVLDRVPGLVTSNGRTLEAPCGPIRVGRQGADLLGTPLLNKGTAFPEDERAAFALAGLLPRHVATIEEQVALELEHVRRKPDALEQYIGLAALQDRNETLFYRLLVSNLEEFAPIVYTPTVGRACQEYSHIFRRARGVWITPDDIGHIDEILEGGASGDVRLLVVTDNERILGLGDQGAGGMGIPVGKLTLYTAAAGIYPSWTLPVSLDVGTDREELLDDPLYLGYRGRRLRGQAYDEMLEAFVDAVGRVFPRALVQWEDFKQHNALRILGRYRHRLPSFNDDVQGTGAVVLAGLLAARASRGGLRGERAMFLGAGAAAIGIASLLARQLEAEGASREEIGGSIVLLDSHGLIHDRRQIADDQRRFSLSATRLAALGLADDAATADPVAVAAAFKPTILVGTTAHAGTFTEALIRAIAPNDPEPIILPLSNPSANTEAQPVDILAWTDGRALVATGSPFPPVPVNGVPRTIAQANNVFIFPGVGLGAIVAEAREVTDQAFLVAAKQLASLVSPARRASGAVYPPIDDLRVAARTIAVALVREFRDSGYGRSLHDDQIEPAVDRAMWWPDYLPYMPA
ncbi:MAG TPA: NAD-dependent malic enzyme [Candidatus Limnocylindrales bacterium]|nr:NAD-dependent malic enzyme [Candidatus Limnocylindrales bacterium]